MQVQTKKKEAELQTNRKKQYNKQGWLIKFISKVVEQKNSNTMRKIYNETIKSEKWKYSLNIIEKCKQAKNVKKKHSTKMKR